MLRAGEVEGKCGYQAQGGARRSKIPKPQLVIHNNTKTWLSDYSRWSANINMSGKRLLDLAALFNATRGVAQKHAALRTRQFEAYNKTSTLAAAVRHQTQRVTETAKAASFLASRLNESAPAWTAEATDEEVHTQPQDGGPIPSERSVASDSSKNGNRDGLEQDHFYEKSADNSTSDAVPSEVLEVQQEQAAKDPLPDGTIPTSQATTNAPKIDKEVFSTRPRNEPPKVPLKQDGLQPASSTKSTIPVPPPAPLTSIAARILQRQSELQIPSKTADALGDTASGSLEKGRDEDSFYRTSGHTSPTLSSLPRVKIPQHPSSIQESDSHLPNKQINSDSYYSVQTPETTQIPSVQAIPEQEQIPEGIDTDVFFSSRVAKKLGGRTNGHLRPKESLGVKGAAGTPIDQTKLAEGRDQDTFNILNSSQKQPTSPEPSYESGPVSVKSNDAEDHEDAPPGISIDKVNFDFPNQRDGISH